MLLNYIQHRPRPLNQNTWNANVYPCELELPSSVDENIHFAFICKCTGILGACECSYFGMASAHSSEVSLSNALQAFKQFLCSF